MGKKHKKKDEVALAVAESAEKEAENAIEAHSAHEGLVVYLPPGYDKRFAPVPAQKLREWWERTPRMENHARFCLPLTMANAAGFLILSPATFTVEWDGKPTSDAQITIQEKCSHAVVDNHSAPGAFTVQAGFMPRTLRAGDFIYVRGVPNAERLPYQFMDGLIEGWWLNANFGLVAILNQPGRFTIRMGEPIAQMFVVNVSTLSYPMVMVDGIPQGHKEWLERRSRREYIGRDMDYLRGQLPDGSKVIPHYTGFQDAKVQECEQAGTAGGENKKVKKKKKSK